jgi:hypothetical protein
MAFSISEPFRLSNEQKKQIAEVLNKKLPNVSCPMCKNKNFVMAEGLFNNYLSSDPEREQSIGGPSVPTVAIICDNCGFTSQHALGILDLLKDKKDA